MPVGLIAGYVAKETPMRKPLFVGSIVAALVVGFVAGWFARPNPTRVVVVPASPARPPSVARSTTMGDEHEAWAKVPPTSSQYATAQRLLGYNYFAHDKHDFIEAKRHVDIALAAPRMTRRFWRTRDACISLRA